MSICPPREGAGGGIIKERMKRILWITGILITLIVLTIAIGLNNRIGIDNPPDENRFISSDNGTVLDTRTGLMWASHDNGDAAIWKEAKKYCEQYTGGGYKDWRMPTIEELKTLYDKDEPGYRPECAVYDWKVYLTPKIHLSGGAVWSAEDHGSEAQCLLFDYGRPTLMFKSVNYIMRALPVRINGGRSLR
jgi:hypothetical protein